MARSAHSALSFASRLDAGRRHTAATTAVQGRRPQRRKAARPNRSSVSVHDGANAPARTGRAQLMNSISLLRRRPTTAVATRPARRPVARALGGIQAAEGPLPQAARGRDSLPSASPPMGMKPAIMAGPERGPEIFEQRVWQWGDAHAPRPRSRDGWRAGRCSERFGARQCHVGRASSAGARAHSRPMDRR